MITIKLNKYIFSMLIFLSFDSISMEITRESSDSNIKKKVLIITSKGGGGHVSASNAIESYYKEQFDINSTILLEEILSDIDFLSKITFGKHNFETLYNNLLKNKNVSAIELLTSKFNYYLDHYSLKIKTLIIKYLLDKNPDIVISVIPLFNQQLLDCCKLLEIPFIILTVDYDTTNYCKNLKDIDYEKFFYVIPFNDELIKNKIKDLNLNNNQLKVSGFPIRSDFFEIKNKELIKKNFNLPDNKKIILILMGATGSSSSINYLEEIAKLDLDLHLIICIGRNDNLVLDLTKVKLPKNLTMSIIGFTNRISDLMAVSDIIITKPGPTSISEALYLNKPILLDYTTEPVSWEKLNIEFIKKHNLGLIIKNLRELQYILPKLLNEAYANELIQRITYFAKKDPKNKIKKLINKLIS